MMSFSFKKVNISQAGILLTQIIQEYKPVYYDNLVTINCVWLQFKDDFTKSWYSIASQVLSTHYKAVGDTETAASIINSLNIFPAYCVIKVFNLI